MKTILAVCLALAMVPAAAMAQHPGFRIGIAQPPAAFPPTQAPAIVTRSTFFGVPTIVQTIQVPQVIVPMMIPAYPTVIIPNQILVPGQTFAQAPTVPFVAQPFIPQSFIQQPFLQQPFLQQPFIQQPFIQQPFVNQPFVNQPFVGQAFVNQPFGIPTQHLPLVIGTPRAEVLRQFGQPSVTILTSTGETLYFTGGVTVIIQNGQVIGPR